MACPATERPASPRLVRAFGEGIMSLMALPTQQLIVAQLMIAQPCISSFMSNMLHPSQQGELGFALSSLPLEIYKDSV